MKRSRKAALAMAALAVPAAAPASDTMSFKYDALGRLSDVATTGGPNDGSTTAVRYDPAGNRTSYSGTGGAAGGAGMAAAAAGPSSDSPDAEMEGPAEMEGLDGLPLEEPSVPTIVEPPAGIPDETEPPSAAQPDGTEGSAGSQGAGQ
jgi:hypothetical protein